MTQVAGQRGSQPLQYALQSKPRKALPSSQGQQSASPAGNGVKFGGGINTGLSLLEKVVPVSIFEKITEVFLVGFLAQDMVAMWLPRVGTSLKVGREPYDPQQDPQAKNLPFHQQIAKWAVGNYKGLNWVNFNEETKREFATGPGLLSVPAIIFVLNRYMGNRAREMSFHSLENLGTGFSDHLKEMEQQGKPIKMKEAVQSYIQSLFVDPKLSTEKQAELKAWSKKWATALCEQESQPKGKRWLESTKRFFSKSEPTKLESLATELGEKVREFNRNAEERMLAYSEKLGAIADEAPLHHAEQTWISYQPGKFDEACEALGKSKTKTALKAAKDLREHMSVDHLTGDLNRFGAYAKEVFNRHAKAKGSKPAISEIAEQTMQHLAGSKVILGVGTTVITALYLLKLAFWAQNHDSYQAVRLLKHDHSHGNSGHPMQPGQQAQRPMGAAVPMQTGLPFGAQPVSLYSGGMQTATGFRAPAPPPMNPFGPSRPMPMTFRAANPQPGWRNA